MGTVSDLQFPELLVCRQQKCSAAYCRNNKLIFSLSCVVKVLHSYSYDICYHTVYLSDGNTSSKVLSAFMV